MDKAHYEEMAHNLAELLPKINILKKNVYLFGHCNATEELVKLLCEKSIPVKAILDNNVEKQGKYFKNIRICAPTEVMSEDKDTAIVLIAARAYAAMEAQLREMGYCGLIRKLVDYNSFAEYSLSEETFVRMEQRMKRGVERLSFLSRHEEGKLKVFCPFPALGDVYIMMSYLPCFLRRRQVSECVIYVVGGACARVVKLFGNYEVETLSQQNMDEILQAIIYTQDENSFIAHHDRPYVVNLHRALYTKLIPLEKMYCCGVFGLPVSTEPVEASVFTQYEDIKAIPKGQSVILSPYAKSVTELPMSVWEKVVRAYTEKGFCCFTNVVGDEVPLKGTIAISPLISEMKSVVEWAGNFVGIRSGLCDVIRAVNAKKIALYPDYNYCDTKWKAAEMYFLSGWENIVIKDEV